MKRQLERWKANVDSCVDGVQAVEKVVERHYDLILMDINMPGMDGFEAAKRFRQLSDPLKTAIPILAVTASAATVTTGISQSPYIDDYMLKPFKVDELWFKLNFFLNAKSS
jgi:CheY-like chemotaxis protein